MNIQKIPHPLFEFNLVELVVLEVCRDEGLALIEEAGIADIMLSLLGCTLDGIVNSNDIFKLRQWCFNIQAKSLNVCFPTGLCTATLEEEAVDTFCALAAHEKMRPNLLDKVKRLRLWKLDSLPCCLVKPTPFNPLSKT